MEKQNPPPYSSTGQGPSRYPAAVEADALLNHLTERVNEQYALDEDYPRGVQAILDRETERIRNMLEFTLSVDYQGYSSASMPASDRKHFVHISKALRELRSTLYLFEPCKALSLPLDYVYASIVALSRYTDGSGAYKGSVFGLLQQDGMEHLAGKLYRDRHVLIPLIITDYTARNRMLHRVHAVEDLYFHSIDGVEGSTLPHMTARNFKTVYNIKFEANQRGIACAKTRKAAIARACKDLSTKYWTRAVSQCVDSILARFKLVKDGKRTPDYPGASWRREDTDIMSPFLERPMDAAIPYGWWRLCSFHITDYCEFRDQVLMNDC